MQKTCPAPSGVTLLLTLVSKTVESQETEVSSEDSVLQASSRASDSRSFSVSSPRKHAEAESSHRDQYGKILIMLF